MMKLEHLFENYDLARKALENWPLDQPILDEQLSRFRISSNGVYPFTFQEELCFLRLAPASEKLKQNLLGELEFIQYLRSRGYPALEPLPAENGALCLVLDTQWGRYFATAFKAVPGEPVENLPLTAEMVYSYGRSLGRLHTLSAEFQPETPKWGYRDALRWAAAILAQDDAPPEMAAALNRLEADLRQLPKEPELFGLVHYDFEPDNVFYHASTHTCSVIDFDDSMYHWYSLDIEQALDSLLQLPVPPGLDAAQLFLRGYQEERNYSAQMEAMRPLMRQFIDIFAYARIFRSLTSRPAAEPDWLVSLRSKLELRLREIRQRVCGG